MRGLSLLPQALRERLHYQLQLRLGSFRRVDPWSRFEGAVEALKELQQRGETIKGERVLEVGSGWRINAPIAFALAGAEAVCTVDLNRYQKLELILLDIQILCRNYNQVRSLFDGLDFSEERWQSLERLSRQTTLVHEDLESALSLAYLAPQNAARLPNEWAKTFLLHYSQNTFEHIPGPELVEILAEARRVLKPGGWAVHLVDHSDHFAHSDHSITRVNFLKYSNCLWNLIAGHPLTYVNRLRAPQYPELFKASGLEVVASRVATDPTSLAAIESGGLRLAPEFLSFAPEEAAGDYSWVIAQKLQKADSSTSV